MTDDLPTHCPACDTRVRAWDRTPQGRPVCPVLDCRAIPPSRQGQPESERPANAGWSG